MKHWWLLFRRVTRDDWCPAEREATAEVGRRRCGFNGFNSLFEHLLTGVSATAALCINKNGRGRIDYFLQSQPVSRWLVESVHVVEHPKRKIRGRILQVLERETWEWPWVTNIQPLPQHCRWFALIHLDRTPGLSYRSWLSLWPHPSHQLVKIKKFQMLFFGSLGIFTRFPLIVVNS